MKLPGLRLRLATSQLIRQWAQRRLPNGKIISGQILNPKTINYQTLKPEKDGLFCERIFGPINDSVCACGRPLRGQKFCPRCEVEYISTRVRRYRLGYIQLITATAHIWFFKGRPSYLSLFLNLSKKKIECLLYCTKNISRTLFPQELSSLNFYSIQKNRLEGLRPNRNFISQNLIFWSFFSERGYWVFSSYPRGMAEEPSKGRHNIQGQRFLLRAIQRQAPPRDFLVYPNVFWLTIFAFGPSILPSLRPLGEELRPMAPPMAPPMTISESAFADGRSRVRCDLYGDTSNTVIRLMEGSKTKSVLAFWKNEIQKRAKWFELDTESAASPSFSTVLLWRLAPDRPILGATPKRSSEVLGLGQTGRERPSAKRIHFISSSIIGFQKRADREVQNRPTALFPVGDERLQKPPRVQDRPMSPKAKLAKRAIVQILEVRWEGEYGRRKRPKAQCNLAGGPVWNPHQLGLDAVSKKSRWQEGGLRDSAVYFGFSLVSKMLSWQMTTHWFSFVYFLIQSPFCGDLLNKFYPGPPGLVNFWGLESRLFCSMGVQLMRTWLTQLTQNQCHDGRLLEIQIRLDLLQLECEPTNVSENEFVQRILLFRRFKYLRSFRHTQMNPASMILSVIPVLPPDLRPILQLDNNQIAVSDLNKLYQTVLLRNKRLSRLTRLNDPNSHCLNSEALQYSQRLLQESVDSLIDNGKVSSSRPASLISLKSLSDLFKGKKGRFRQNLLGKRVDYSGRSVIVVGPYLKIYECGLPKEIAYELFQPFLLRILMFKNQAQTILGAKKLLQQKPFFIWNLLKEVVHSHPILLNRAPSLHRLSIQAFQPRLIEGKAILLHPLVCAAFNADFDGDQMGVHLPLCFEARGEAWKITWSQNNLFSIATGSPTCSPSQDMILGSSFLTMENTQKWGFNLLKTQTISYPSKIRHWATGRINAEFQKWEGSKNTIVRRIHIHKWLLFEKPYFFKSNLTTGPHRNSHLTGPSAKCWPSRPVWPRPSLPLGVLPGELKSRRAEQGPWESRPTQRSVLRPIQISYFDKKNSLSETTLPRSLVLSFSQKSHPFIYLNFPHLSSLAKAQRTSEGFSRVHSSARWLGRAHHGRPALEKGAGGKFLGSFLYFLKKTSNVLMRNMNDPIWYSCNPSLNKLETEKKKQKLIEIRINSRGQFQKFRSQFFQQYHSSGVELLRKIRTTYGRIQFLESLNLFE